jgi:hypothetical protein
MSARSNPENLSYFILGIDGAHGVVLLTQIAFGTLEAAELCIKRCEFDKQHAFIVREIKEFQS